MKRLLQRTGRYYLLLSVGLFVLIGVALFTALRWSLNHELDEALFHAGEALRPQLSRLDSLPARVEIMNEVIELQPIERVTNYRRFADTTLFDPRPGEMEYEPFRKYTYDAAIDGRAFRITLCRSQVENEDIAEVIGLTLIGALGAGLLTFIVLTQWLNRRLWRPFQQSLRLIGAFDVRQEEIPSFPTTNTAEFTELNRSLEHLTTRLVADYQSLRRFTENASHELQTPLAVIRHQIDLLLREGERSEADYAILQRLSEAVYRLDKLNQSLLLLAKIEHGQIPEADRLDLQPLVAQKLDQLLPVIEERAIRLTRVLDPQPVLLPRMLADVLLNNLLSNAIRHNVDGGELLVQLGDGELRIENSGLPLSHPPEQLFERFRKAGHATDSLGLGLAIVREICDKYGCSLAYEYAAERHRIRVLFPG